MTTRERRLARAERLRGWAEKREERDSTPSAAEKTADQIPFGQPILVGHHSERAHRNAVDKAWNAMGRRVESLKTAERMDEKADNIERAAAASIYDDDPDAIERLREKLERLEEARATMKKRNAEWLRENKAEAKAMTAYERDQARPHAGYELTNLGGRISAARKRLAQMEREAESGDTRGPGKQMAARYAGECAECGAAVATGDSMTYYRRTREVVCGACS